MYFEDNAELPERLSMGYMKHHLWTMWTCRHGNYNCQRYGHTAKICRKSTSICSICAGEHKWNECPEGSPPKCANCGKFHTTRDLNCEARAQALRKAKAFAYCGSAAVAKTPAKSSPQAWDNQTVTNGPIRRQTSSRGPGVGSSAPVPHLSGMRLHM